MEEPRGLGCHVASDLNTGKINKSPRLWYTFIELRSSDCYPQTITYSLCVSLLAAGRALAQGSAVLLNRLNICGLGVGLFIVKNRNLHKFRNPSAKGTKLKLVRDCYVAPWI